MEPLLIILFILIVVVAGVAAAKVFFKKSNRVVPLSELDRSSIYEVRNYSTPLTGDKVENNDFSDIVK